MLCCAILSHYIDCIEEKRSMSKIEIVEEFNSQVSNTDENTQLSDFLEFLFRNKYYCVWALRLIRKIQ